MIGGGVIAERRVDALATAGAHLIVISPRLTPALAALAAAGRIEHEPRGYREGDLAGADLAFVATNAGEVNAAVAREARERQIWVNAADDPARCTFILPALVRRGDLTVAVATGGSSPALARAIREELEAYLTDDYATLAAIAAEARKEVRASGRPVTAEAWRRALGPEVRRLIVERGREDAKHRLLELLEAGS
jgi:siroheme synthase-like protein